MENFFVGSFQRADHVIYVPKILNYYRKHVLGQNIANQKQRVHIESQFIALDSKYDELITLKDSVAFKSAFSLQYKWLAINAYPEFKDIASKAIQSLKNWEEARTCQYWEEPS